MLGFPLIWWMTKTLWTKEGIKKQREQLNRQFVDVARCISNSLNSGYSIENAFVEAQRECEQLYGANACMSKELREMNQLQGVNVPIEQLLEQFAQRTGQEDIMNFSEVFQFAKRGGGNLVYILNDTILQMRLKQEVEADIAVIVASKKLEQTIMCVMPLAIVAYLRVTSADYLEVLYGTIPGVLFMTACLLVYAFGIWLGQKILQIQV